MGRGDETDSKPGQFVFRCGQIRIRRRVKPATKTGKSKSHVAWRGTSATTSPLQGKIKLWGYLTPPSAELPKTFSTNIPTSNDILVRRLLYLRPRVTLFWVADNVWVRSRTFLKLRSNRFWFWPRQTRFAFRSLCWKMSTLCFKTTTSLLHFSPWHSPESQCTSIWNGICKW